MKASNILLLLYCIETLMVVFCGPDVFPTNIEPVTGPEKENVMTRNVVQETTAAASTMLQTIASTMPQTDDSNTSTIAASEASNSTSSESTVTPNGQSTPKYSVSNPPCPIPTITKHNDKLYKPECLRELVVAGGLIILCAVLLISTVSLTCKVCQLSRHIKNLKRRDSEPISNSGMGTPMKEKNKSETEAIETTVLMADVSQTQEEVGNSGTKEEEEKVINDGQMREENGKEPRDTAQTSTGENEKEKLVISDENPSSPNLQEETADSQSAKAVAASSSEGTEEPKDVV